MIYILKKKVTTRLGRVRFLEVFIYIIASFIHVQVINTQKAKKKKKYKHL